MNIFIHFVLNVIATSSVTKMQHVELAQVAHLLFALVAKKRLTRALAQKRPYELKGPNQEKKRKLPPKIKNQLLGLKILPQLVHNAMFVSLKM